MQLHDARATRERLPFTRLIPALRDLLVEGCAVPERQVNVLPGMTSLVMPAWTTGPGRRYYGIKTINIAPGNGARGLPALHASYLLHDAETGVPLALIDGDEITARRTAAASALAASLLVRAAVSRLLVVGAGRIARLLPEAYRSVLPIRHVTVWARDADRAHTLAAALRADGIDATASADLAAAAAAADVVSCATLATSPLIQGRWLRADGHLDLIGSFTPAMREADDDCFAGAAIYVDSDEALRKSGDLLGPIERGVFAGSDVRGTLAGLARGEVRRPPAGAPCSSRSATRSPTSRPRGWWSRPAERALSPPGPALACAMHRYTDAEVAALLVAAGVVQRLHVSPVGRFVLFVSFIVLSAVLALGYQWWLVGLDDDDLARLLPNGGQIGTSLVAVVAAVFAYYQWADARREASLEKFYERLKLTNEQYARSEHARQLVGHFWDEAEGTPGFDRRMYTFLELDNLEYMLLRYQLGFVRKRLMWRAIRTFAARCESPPFRALALKLASGSGYDDKTRAVTEVLARGADARRQRSTTRGSAWRLSGGSSSSAARAAASAWRQPCVSRAQAARWCWPTSTKPGWRARWRRSRKAGASRPRSAATSPARPTSPPRWRRRSTRSDVSTWSSTTPARWPSSRSRRSTKPTWRRRSASTSVARSGSSSTRSCAARRGRRSSTCRACTRCARRRSSRPTPPPRRACWR